ncbi:MAG: ParA family protein [Bdellovibrionales bacterium]|jgi:chromosome partitioning protein|nr:ParA family protein [Bdellovibrionales bacterium]
MSEFAKESQFKMDLYLTPKELADILGITVQALHKFLKETEIQTRIGNSRFHRIEPSKISEILQLRGLSFPSMVIDLHNVKGGVGKTTCTHALATRAATYGARVLMIDLDQQANLTGSFGIHGNPREFPTIMDILDGSFNGKQISVKDAIINLIPNLHLIPSNLAMANLDTLLSLNNSINISSLFANMLKPVRQEYDFIFFDSPPSLSKLTSAAHIYSDLILMPVEPDKFSLDGLELNFEHIARLRKNFGARAVTKIFINKYDGRPKIDYLIASELAKTDYGKQLCESAVGFSSGLKASIAEGKTIWNTAKKHVALEHLDSLFLEITNLKEFWRSQRSLKNSDSAASSLVTEVQA